MCSNLKTARSTDKNKTNLSKMPYQNIREEELKNRVTQDYFNDFDCAKIIGNIDFCVTTKNNNSVITHPLGAGGLVFELESLLWAEAKKGKANIYNSLVQLILTIGKARTFDKSLPPAYLGAFDAEKIAFIPYNDISDIFYINDFNWNVTPSNHEAKEFKLLLEKVTQTIDKNSLLFFFDKDEKEIKTFINTNFIVGKAGTSKIKIDKNNFMVIYNKWLQVIKPTINVSWDVAKKVGIIDGDFYLADLLSAENESLKDNLYVLLKKDKYELDRKIDDMGMFSSRAATFNDKKKAHTQFWNKYDRPPKEEYWDYIVERRDLLVPQDVRERKGSFFTPQIWVELSQKYLTDVLGTDWQDDYYIWDCAAGTGNLLAGLTNKYNIFASTLDRQDVDVMHDRIKNGANLLEKQCFQFDFLNDSFDKLPKSLKAIIDDPEKRKKLLMYINPPYAEASDKKTFKRIEGKSGVEQSKINKEYAKLLGQGNAELFAQFFTRIYFEIEGCMLAEFSTLKILSGQHFVDFRKFFLAKLEKVFVVPADTFDNVKGKFPIAFMIWDTKKKEKFEKILADVYINGGEAAGNKSYFAYDNSHYINDWIKPYRADVSQNQLIGKFPFKGSDFQNQNLIQIVHHKMDYNTEAGQFYINQKNVIYVALYFAVRKCIGATWLNDRDQFLFPNDGWQTDYEFQNDCLAYTLFSNNIQSKYGVNHWIPFTEQEINAKERLESNFMSKYINGKIDKTITSDLFSKMPKTQETPLLFSLDANAVFDAGRELWRYYHDQKIGSILYGSIQYGGTSVNVNASLYDIREHFQGRSTTGKMNNKSTNEAYSLLIANLRDNLKILAKKIAPKVYEYGFLKA